jgi:hypothetical protein
MVAPGPASGRGPSLVAWSTSSRAGARGARCAACRCSAGRCCRARTLRRSQPLCRRAGARAGTGVPMLNQ